MYYDGFFLETTVFINIQKINIGQLVFKIFGKEFVFGFTELFYSQNVLLQNGKFQVKFSMLFYKIQAHYYMKQ